MATENGFFTNQTQFQNDPNVSQRDNLKGFYGTAVRPAYIEDLVAKAEEAAVNSKTYSDQSKLYRDEAEGFKDIAEQTYNLTVGVYNDTVSARDLASQYRDQSLGYANNATQSATEAATSAANAEQSYQDTLAVVPALQSQIDEKATKDELNEGITESQNDIVGGSIFKGSNGEYVQNGDIVPVGTTHLSVLIGGESKIVSMSPVASGVVSLLTETGATIGTTVVGFGGYEKATITYKTVEDLKANNPVQAKVGDTLIIAERSYSEFLVEESGSGNGFDSIPLDFGYANLQITDRTINPRQLGFSLLADNSNGLTALNALITSGNVVKILLTDVWPTSKEYIVPSTNHISYIGLHGGLKPTLSGLEFTHTDGQDGWVLPNRGPGWHLENLYSKGNLTGGDGFKYSGTAAANCTACSLYAKDWGNDGHYINNLFVARLSNLMSEDTGRDGIHLDLANEVEIYGASSERAGRWGWNIEDGYINTITGNASDCGTGSTGGGCAVQKGGSNTINLYYESVDVSRSRKAFLIGNKAIDTQMTARIARTDTWLDDGINSNVKATGQGVFNADPRNLLLNITNPSFEQSALGTSGWLSNEGSVALSRENDGDSGNYSLKATITGSSGNANFYASGAGYNYDVAQDQTIFVEFSIKTSRPISVNGGRGEYAIFELVGLSDAEPGFYNVIPETSNQWRRVSMTFSANIAATNVRPRFKIVGLTGSIDVQVTDIVYTTNLSPAKKTVRPDSVATDVAGVVADLNLLIEDLRGQGLFARG
ncbi:hypothetical protein [Vibrio phage VpJYP1]|nr:hypothetical protein [Vibrio phage VpJYP1]